MLKVRLQGALTCNEQEHLLLDKIKLNFQKKKNEHFWRT